MERDVTEDPIALGELHELGRTECFRLLAIGVVGRVAFSALASA